MTASRVVIYSRFATFAVSIEAGCNFAQLFLREGVAVIFTLTVAPFQGEGLA